jgi:hypothetical protein
MKRPCRYPGCPTLITIGTHCPTHTAKVPSRHAIYDERRQRDPALARNAAFRNSHEWISLRRWKLYRNPLCQDPHGIHARQHDTESAVDVDHIEGLTEAWDRRNDPDNLMALCRRCHSIKEQAHRRNKRNDP